MENANKNALTFFDETPSDLIREHRQIYLIINATAKRVRQLQLGERPLALPADGSRDPVYIAREEFMQDKLRISERVVAADFDPELDNSQGEDLLYGLGDEELSLDGTDDED